METVLAILQQVQDERKGGQPVQDERKGAAAPTVLPA